MGIAAKNKLAIPVYNDCEQIAGKGCGACNFFAGDNAAIASITFREWAKVKPYGGWYYAPP